jgi:hypothetical protein
MSSSLQWRLRSGRRLYAREMTDSQLARAFRIGMRKAVEHYRAEALECAAAAAGADDGSAYLADVQYEALMAKARDRKALLGYMCRVPKLAELLRVIKARRRTRQAEVCQHVAGLTA